MVILRPDCLTSYHLEYLDMLHDTGIANMYDAIPHLHDAFRDLTPQQAKGCVVYWISTFDTRHPK